MEYKQVWRFYCDTAVLELGQGETVELSADEAHYAYSVLRLSSGEQVELADGLGRTAHATLVQVDKRSVKARIESLHCVPQSKRKLVALVGLTKPSALDEVIQNCTEAGVHSLILFRAEKTTSKQDVKLDKIARQVREMCRITKASHCMQVSFVDSLALALSALKLEYPSVHLLICDERPAHLSEMQMGTQHLLTAASLHNHDCIAFVVGPEASFSAREYLQLNEHETAGRAYYVSLGPRILRTPAAVAAAAYMLSGVFDSHP